MGVPKFFRYTSERYPCLNELVKQYQIPDFDNMYLDMNGIIHNCSHPDDSNPHFRITEEKIFKDIFHYISILFQIIKPKKLFFMAIDGVAPRAKMNQQRGRRFRSAKEAEKLEEAAKAKGEALPTEKRFDSNCITPGTVFMARLHEQLKYFVKEKISTDPLWSKVQVILSGHETPGEGEHKIMDYIRWLRSQPQYDPATRHCLYGLDADLIMLGVCTHEPHFALLREEVKFGKTTQRATSPEETNFYLLHLSLLREYLEQEFISIKEKLPFPYDIEKIVDDWVLMGFLVGNDFIPNLPNMHISNDALPVLYKTYMTVLPTLDGYINEAGDLHLGRFEIFMQELAKIDKEKFQDTYADLKYFEAKTGRRPNANERKEYKPNNDDTFNVNLDDIKANKPDDELQALIDATQEMFMEDMKSDDEYEDISDEEANMEMEFILHKKDYYMNKLDYSKVTDEVLSDQAECYVRAIQWNLWYYYRGCPSWCWYYPHHYAPYISDVKDFGDMKMEFELGEPFKPFEQLLAVLPGASRHLLPMPFHDLMTDEDSAIVHYYPVDFTTDLNGKKNDWEAVVLLPFIDETNLLSAMAPCYQRLTEEELRRNSHGPMLVYNWTSENLGPITAPEFFSSIKVNHAIEKRVWRNELDVPLDQLKRGMLPNANKDIMYPGFPTMRHLKYQSSLKKCKVKVFDQPSRNESMILQIITTETNPPLEDFARTVLGKVIWVGWPHLTRAKVISVSNEKMRLHHVDTQDKEKVQFTVERNNGNLHQQWISERSTIIEHNMNRLGIELGEINVIIHAVNLRGYKHIIQDNSRMVVEEQWCSVSCGYALQAAVLGSAPPPPPALTDPAAAYPPGDGVFLVTAGQYYGCMATVVNSEAIRSGRIKVSVRECDEPVPAAPAAAAAATYRTAHHAAAACGISNQLLSRITGTVLVIPGERNDLPTETQNKINVGLNLKFNKKNQEVSGYSRRCSSSGSWLYSSRCVSLVRSYASSFPELFDALSSSHRDVFFESDLWPTLLGKNKLQDIAAWLKSQPHSSAARRECGSEALEPEEMKALYDILKTQIEDLEGKEKNVTLHVKWSLLYKPELHQGNIQPDPKADFEMYDRVVCVSKNITVPLGAKGTITAIYQPSNSNTVRLSDKLNAAPTYQVMFDQPFPGAMTEDLFEEGRFYRMQPTHILNISYGRKIRKNLSMEPFEYSRSSQQNNYNSTTYSTQKQQTTTPTLLRRSDGHHSAFASYSPPREIKTPVAVENNSNVNNNIKNELPPDNATCLLRSLLRISEGDGDGGKKNKNVPETNTNWRAKNDNRSQSPTKTTQNNWRKESNSYSQGEWTQTQKKQQQPIGMPAIPYPTFTALPRPPHHQPHPPSQPHLSHHQSHPQAHYQPQPHHHPQPQAHLHHPSYQPQQPQPQPHNQARYQGNQSNQAFPKHLPDVSQGIALMPAWSRGENLKTVHVPSQPGTNQQTNNGEKYSNPFVPLQVQTSQRRVQHTSVPQRRELEGVAAVKEERVNTHTTLINPQQQASRPQRKKKTRIAANLPFQMD